MDAACSAAHVRRALYHVKKEFFVESWDIPQLPPKAGGYRLGQKNPRKSNHKAIIAIA